MTNNSNILINDEGKEVPNPCLIPDLLSKWFKVHCLRKLVEFSPNNYYSMYSICISWLPNMITKIWIIKKRYLSIFNKKGHTCYVVSFP